MSDNKQIQEYNALSVEQNAVSYEDLHSICEELERDARRYNRAFDEQSEVGVI